MYKKRKLVIVFLLTFLIVSFTPKSFFAVPTEDNLTEATTKTWKKVYTSGEICVGILEDNSLWQWCTYTNNSSPLKQDKFVTPVKMLEDVSEVEIGKGYILALTNDNNLWSWGTNKLGELGDGSNIDRVHPKIIMKDVVRISAGKDSSTNFAIKSDGTLWGWGDNIYGQLGDGTKNIKNIPTLIEIGTSKKTNTTLNWQEKNMDYEQVDNTLLIRKNMIAPTITTPTKIDKSINSESVVVKSIVTGSKHTLALMKDNSLWAWGNNHSGQLGNGAYDESLIPVKIMDDVEQIAVDDASSFAIKTDHTLWSWGDNRNFQLGGDLTVYKRSTPKKVLSNVLDIIPNSGCICVLTIDKTLYSFRSDSDDISTTIQIDACLLIKLKENVSKVSVNDHILAVDENKYLWMWKSTQSNSKAIYKNVSQIATDFDLSSFVTYDGELFQFGYINGREISDPINIPVPTYIDSIYAFDNYINVQFSDNKPKAIASFDFTVSSSTTDDSGQTVTDSVYSSVYSYDPNMGIAVLQLEDLPYNQEQSILYTVSYNGNLGVQTTLLPTPVISDTPQPTITPSYTPTPLLTSQPTSSSTLIPTSTPTTQPSSTPTPLLTSQPSSSPTLIPTSTPTTQPSSTPIPQLTSQPSSSPTLIPTSTPTTQPSSTPTPLLTSQPSSSPTPQPTSTPTTQPSSTPQLTSQPSSSPTLIPTSTPTTQPSSTPTPLLTSQPSSSPTLIPTSTPTTQPSSTPQLTSQPTSSPTPQPTKSKTSSRKKSNKSKSTNVISPKETMPASLPQETTVLTTVDYEKVIQTFELKALETIEKYKNSDDIYNEKSDRIEDEIEKVIEQAANAKVICETGAIDINQELISNQIELVLKSSSEIDAFLSKQDYEPNRIYRKVINIDVDLTKTKLNISFFKDIDVLKNNKIDLKISTNFGNITLYHETIDKLIRENLTIIMTDETEESNEKIKSNVNLEFKYKNGNIRNKLDFPIGLELPYKDGNPDYCTIYNEPEYNLHSSENQKDKQTLFAMNSNVFKMQAQKPVFSTPYTKPLGNNTTYSTSSNKRYNMGGRENTSNNTLSIRTFNSGKYYVIEQKITFNDIKYEEAAIKEAIESLASKGIINGRGDGSFHPDDQLSRSEFACLIVKSLNIIDEEALAHFKDVKETSWYYNSVAIAYKENLILGYEDNTFKGNKRINRQELITVCSTTLNVKKDYLFPKEDKWLNFTDKNLIPSWARKFIALGNRESLVVKRSDGEFNGTGLCSRKEAAIILYRLYRKL